MDESPSEGYSDVGQITYRGLGLPVRWRERLYSVATLEGSPIKKLASDTSFLITDREPGVLGPEVREQIREPVVVHIPMVIVKPSAFCQIA